MEDHSSGVQWCGYVRYCSSVEVDGSSLGYLQRCKGKRNGTKSYTCFLYVTLDERGMELVFLIRIKKFKKTLGKRTKLYSGLSLWWDLQLQPTNP